MSRGFFITATGTNVGKTVATLVLGHLFQDKGVDVGVMKPVQCSGNDAELLVNGLDIKDDFDLVNPFYSHEPLSPNIAFARPKRTINIKKIKNAYTALSWCHDLMLVEGAGGLCVPLKKNYLIADLIKELNLDVIVVCSLGLGTINHTLLTIKQARNYGLNVKGIIFSNNKKSKGSIAEDTNPNIIKQFSDVPILGTIPYLTSFSRKVILNKCRNNIKLPQASGAKNSIKDLQKQDKKYIWHPFTQMQGWGRETPLVIDCARGSYLIDADGNEYIDGISSLWVNVHGHGQKDINQALKDQVNKLSHSTLLGLANTPSIELAKKLVAITPRGLEKVFYSDNGSTAVEIAIKLAYQYWQNQDKKKKVKIVHLENSYHGDTLGSVSVGGIGLFHKVYRHLTFDAIKLSFPDGYRDQSFDQSLKRLKKLFSEKHQSIAALVVEPIVQGAAGMIMWPKGILKQMEGLCKENDVLLIADEVATGFGRTGKMFACEHEHVTPDFLCLAKGMTGGYLPLAATLTTKRIYEGFLFDDKELKSFFHGHTYTGNPLACSAALASLKVFEKEQVMRNLKGKIKYLQNRLQMFYNLGSVGDVRQCGFMVGIELVADRKAKKPFPLEKRIGVKVCQKVRERGVILRPLGDVIVLMPPLSIKREEISYLLDATYWAIEEIVGK